MPLLDVRCSKKKAIKLNHSLNQSLSLLWVWKLLPGYFKITITSSRGQWVKSVTTVFNYTSCHQLREHRGPKIRCNEVVGEDRGVWTPCPEIQPPYPCPCFSSLPIFSLLALVPFFSSIFFLVPPQLRFLSPDPRPFFITSPPTPAPLIPGLPSSLSSPTKL